MIVPHHVPHTSEKNLKQLSLFPLICWCTDKIWELYVSVACVSVLLSAENHFVKQNHAHSSLDSPIEENYCAKSWLSETTFQTTSLDVGNSNCHYGKNYVSWLFVISKQQSFWFYVWNTICMFTFRWKRFFLSDILEVFLPHMLYGMHYPNLSSVLFKNNISWCYVTYDLHLFWGTVV